MGSYLVKQGIVYLTLADTRYPQKLAFMFLSEISDSFKAELQNTYGSGSGVDHLSRIETIDSQYAFIKFGKSFYKLTVMSEKQINMKLKEFRDVNAKQNIDKLN